MKLVSETKTNAYELTYLVSAGFTDSELKKVQEEVLALVKKFKGEVIVDLGLQNATFKGSRLYAAVKGIKDSGVDVKVSDVVFPTEERINGSHLVAKDAKTVIDKVKKSIEGLK